MEKLVERLATITHELVKYPSVEMYPTYINDCLECAKKRILMNQPLLEIKGFESRGKRSLLFYAGKNPPKVLMVAHLDVVDAPSQHDFSTSTIDEFRLRGRGTADMKGPAAAMIDIMATEPVTGLGLLLTTDEEIGGMDGVGHILDTISWRPDVVILPDGGANMRLITDQKGILRLRVVATGKSAHSSRPWIGDNAILHITNAYQSLLQAYPPPTQEDDPQPAITLSGILGGSSQNTIPWYAEGTLDIRFSDDQPKRFDLLKEDVQQHLARFGIAAHVIAKSPGFHLNAQSPFVAKLQDVATHIIKRPLPLSREAGASDARYFSNLDIPVLMFQPECAGWHSDDEWINLESLGSFRAICLNFARVVLGKEKLATSSTKLPAPQTPGVPRVAKARKKAVATTFTAEATAKHVETQQGSSPGHKKRPAAK